MKKAVVLHSGGLDSSTVLAIAQHENFEVFPLFFAYGQRHAVEARAAQKVLNFYGITTGKIMPVDLSLWGGSALTDLKIDVPHDAVGKSAVPVTYVPARNLVFLSLATAYAESIGAFDIFIGVNNVDYSGYPDCRPAFINAFETCAKLATRAADNPAEKYTIHAPLQYLSKAQIVKKACELNVPLSLTHSCYSPDEKGHPCGHCDSCLLRAAGFAEAGISDPAYGFAQS